MPKKKLSLARVEVLALRRDIVALTTVLKPLVRRAENLTTIVELQQQAILRLNDVVEQHQELLNKKPPTRRVVYTFK